MDREDENQAIVIVGGGICGLATALALHRKGIRSVILERSETLRATAGAAIGILPNGWRALNQLGVASTLTHPSAVTIHRSRDVWIDNGWQRQTSLVGKAICLKRSDLVMALADALPPATIQFGRRIVSLNLDPLSGYPILQLHDGASIGAKVVIGCDGVNSVVANFLGLKPTKIFGQCAVRGLTSYPNGHAFTHEFVRLRRTRGNILVGRIPINHQLVYWFVVQSESASRMHEGVSQDPELIRQSALESTSDGFPSEIREMIANGDAESLSLTRLRYRAPWDLLLARFRRGTVTVAGDAMHVMGPFLGQGGSAALEDAVVLARCLAAKHDHITSMTNGRQIGEAMDEYLRERRMRVIKLSTQTYLTGVLLRNPGMLLKFTCILLIFILFTNPTDHTKYDCGQL